MEFTLKISSDNEAMRTADDVSRALAELARHLRNREWEDHEGTILDDSGCAAGSWELSGALVEEDTVHFAPEGDAVCGKWRTGDGQTDDEDCVTCKECEAAMAPPDPCADGHMFDFADVDGRKALACVRPGCGRVA